MSLANSLQSELFALNASVYPDEPLSRHTSFKVGGPADFFVEPSDASAIESVMKLALLYDVPLLILGRGTNILARDEGVKGIVMKVGHSFCRYNFSGSLLYAGSGTTLPLLAREAAQRGLSGLEFACGIPGSVGGAVYMNAGADGKEISDIVREITIISIDGESKIASDDLYFEYRYCSIQKVKGVITEVVFELVPGESVKIENEIKLLLNKRKSSQPRLPNGGSVFRNPAQGAAGYLIEKAGAKGICVGDAQISEVHANFIVNRGSASASDILSLICIVRKKVREAFGVELELEVQIVGEG